MLYFIYKRVKNVIKKTENPIGRQINKKLFWLNTSEN